MPASFPKLVHWSARLVALLVASFFIFLFVAEILAPHSRAPVGFTEWGKIALLVGSILGMLAAWKWELPGSAFSLTALFMWALSVQMNVRPDIMLLLAAPSLLFLSDWALHYGMRHERNP